MGDEEERNTLTFWVAGERATRAVLSTDGPKEIDGRLDMPKADDVAA